MSCVVDRAQAAVAAHLPQRLGRGRVGDVECVVATPAGVQTADQDGAPAAAIPYIHRNRRSVYEILVLAGIAAVRELPHVGRHLAWDESPRFLAGRGVEGVKHAVIGPNVQSWRAALHRFRPIHVTRRDVVLEREARRADVQRHGVDRVSQRELTVAINLGFVLGLPTQEVDHVRCRRWPPAAGCSVRGARTATAAEARLRTCP